VQSDAVPRRISQRARIGRGLIRERRRGRLNRAPSYDLTWRLTGAPSATRTRDLLLRRQLLCPLSYRGQPGQRPRRYGRSQA
jgi:hypothetical protein